jgi:hypothetical protein
LFRIQITVIARSAASSAELTTVPDAFALPFLSWHVSKFTSATIPTGSSRSGTVTGGSAVVAGSPLVDDEVECAGELVPPGSVGWVTSVGSCADGGDAESGAVGEVTGAELGAVSSSPLHADAIRTRAAAEAMSAPRHGPVVSLLAMWAASFGVDLVGERC